MLVEIECGVEMLIVEIEVMCLELVGCIIGDECVLCCFGILEVFWSLIVESWQCDDCSFYGWFDLIYDGRLLVKLFEYNVDMLMLLFEVVVFQWMWFEQVIECWIVFVCVDQFNLIYEWLIVVWSMFGSGCLFYFVGMIDNVEDVGMLVYFEDIVCQVGLLMQMFDIVQIGWCDEGGGFVDFDDCDIVFVFKFYFWEWMFCDVFGMKVKEVLICWIELLWKVVFFNKGILLLFWEMCLYYFNLLLVFFEDDLCVVEFGKFYVCKLFLLCEGVNIMIVFGGMVFDVQLGFYGVEGFVWQVLVLLLNFFGFYFVVGSWLVDYEFCGLLICEDESLIIGNCLCFLLYVIL